MKRDGSIYVCVCVRETDRDSDRYPVRLRLSEAEIVRDKSRVQETEKHRFINKCYIIFYFHSDLGTTLRAAIMQRHVASCMLFFSLLEELITSGVGIHLEKTRIDLHWSQKEKNKC